MVKFARTRPAIERQHLQEYFELDDPYTLSVDVAAAEHAADGANNEHLNERLCTMRVNTIELGLKDGEIKKPVAASARAINMEKHLTVP